MLHQVWSLTRKELKLWSRKPGQWIVVFAVPLLFIWIMSTVFGASGVPTVAVFLVNEDSAESGKASAAVLAALETNNNLEVEVLPSRAEADRRVGAGERMAAVVIPQGFSAAVLTKEGGKIDVIVDPARSERAGIVTGLVNAALGPFIVDTEVTRGVNQGIASAVPITAAGEAASSAALQKFLAAALKGVVSAQVQQAINDPLVRVVMVSTAQDPQARPPTLLEGLAPGYSLMFAFYLVSMMALTVVEERESGTLRRLLVMPATKRVILMGKTLPFYIIALVQLSLILLASHFLFGMRLGTSPAGLALMIASTGLAVVGLGILIAAVVQNYGQAGGVTIMVVMAMAAVSGSMFPTIRVPVLEYLTPHYWSVLGLQNVISRGMGVQGALLPAAVLAAIGIGCFLLGAARFKFE